ncbi:MAG: hypothetical protein CSA36_06430 [Draconibacterium sp.]|nr:MAG: hypothetical protein CSA36_06430 [Draconibacterium sp.]
MAKISGTRSLLSNIGILVFFLVLAYAYMFPVLDGKVLHQSDIEHFKGMAKELIDYREATGEEAIWTNSMFCGMPGYLISVVYPGNLMRRVHRTFFLAFPIAAFLLLYLIGFYILLLKININRWLSIVGAIAFGLSSYSLIILAAGHNSKAAALGYLPIVIAGVLLVFRKKWLPGFIIFSIGLSFEILAGHLQITYYGLILIVIYGIVELVFAIKEKALQSFFKATLFLLAGTIIAVAMNFSRLYTTYQFSKETIRGPSELSQNSENKTSGLDKDYVVQWSYGIDETLTLLIPNFKGGATQINAGVDSKSYEVLRQRGVQNPRNVVRSVSMYHGTQPSTAGPVYLGAIVVFLFVLGLFVVKGRYKWWLLSATIVSIILSWGGNIMGLTSFLLDYLPLYNKFRAPSMILVIAQITVPLLGFIALNDILTGKVAKKEWLNGLKWAAIITGGISLLFAIFPSMIGSFSSRYDAMQQFPDWLVDAAVADRIAALRSDAFRSFIFIALAAGLLYLWNVKKIKTIPLIAILGVLVLADLWTVDKRYLNNDNFVAKRKVDNPFPEMPVDKAILQDKDLYYRVLQLNGNAFQDARTSYFHKNVGGYTAAKLRRYQELIDHHILPEMQQLVNGLQAGKQPDSIAQQLSVINMLNTRYFIFDLNNNPLRNNNAYGNAWFSDNYQIVENADEEIAMLKNIDPRVTTVIDKRFSGPIEGKQFQKDEDGAVELIEYQTNCLKYKTNASSEQLVVFSDIYFENGWKAYIDDIETPILRANYVLRALVVPEGEHEIEFKFHPSSYYVGNKISMAGSILLLLIIAGYFVAEFMKKRKQEVAPIEE